MKDRVVRVHVEGQVAPTARSCVLMTLLTVAAWLAGYRIVYVYHWR